MAETAGLVLGVIPLVIEGLKLYIRGFETARRYRKYKVLVCSLARTLEMEGTIFSNNCILLLQDLVTEKELALLLESPDGLLWKDQVLESKLREKLQASFRPFLQTLASLTVLMEVLKTKIGMEDGEARDCEHAIKFKTILTSAHR